MDAIIEGLKRWREAVSVDPNIWARSRDIRTRLKATGSSGLNNESVFILAADESEIVRNSLALCPRTLSPEQDLLLIGSASAAKRRSMALGFRLSEDALNILANDTDELVRAGCASTPGRLPECLAKKFAVDPSKIVKRSLLVRAMRDHNVNVSSGCTMPMEALLDLSRWLGTENGTEYNPHGINSIWLVAIILRKMHGFVELPDKEVTVRLMTFHDREVRLAMVRAISRFGQGPASRE